LGQWAVFNDVGLFSFFNTILPEFYALRLLVTGRGTAMSYDALSLSENRVHKEFLEEVKYLRPLSLSVGW